MKRYHADTVSENLGGSLVLYHDVDPLIAQNETMISALRAIGKLPHATTENEIVECPTCMARDALRAAGIPLVEPVTGIPVTDAPLAAMNRKMFQNEVGDAPLAGSGKFAGTITGTYTPVESAKPTVQSALEGATKIVKGIADKDFDRWAELHALVTEREGIRYSIGSDFAKGAKLNEIVFRMRALIGGGA